jgi:hypothetical protein
VSGVLALLLSKNPALNSSSALQVLQQRAIVRSSSECPRACGAGLLNADMPELR